MKWWNVTLVAAAIAAVLGWMGWSLYASGGLGDVGSGGSALVLVIVGGVAGTGLLAGALMWLAFYSSRRGWDEPARFEPHLHDASDDEA
jgi:hypothetical protein